MRTVGEICRAIKMIGLYGGRYKDEQREVLNSRLTERQVFDKYVNLSAEKDENLFFAARDAARYLSGQMQLCDLLPEMPEVPENEDEQGEGLVTLTHEEYENLIGRIERLERVANIRSRHNSLAIRKSVEHAPKDLISQAEACRLLGCDKNRIRQWVNKGLLTTYVKGRFIYYSRKGLLSSEVVMDYQQRKKDSEV